MSELVVAKAGGTSNSSPEAVMASLGWAEHADIFVPSAPGRLIGEQGPSANKVTDMLIAAWREHVATGGVTDYYPDLVTDRYADIIHGLDRSATLPPSWLSNIAPRIRNATNYGEAATSMLGERLQAEIYTALGFRLLDPSRAPHDLGGSRKAWHDWLEVTYMPGQRHVLIGNTTRVDGQQTTFSRGGSDTTAGYAAYGIGADIHLNLTDGSARSADPRLIDMGRLRQLPHLLYEEGRELGRNGTGLVHPAAMVPLMLGNIPTQIRSTFDREAPFTTLDNDRLRAEQRAGKVMALSLMENVVVHRVHEPGMAEAIGRLAAYEIALAERDIAIIDSQGDGVDAQKYYINEEDADRAEAVLRGITEGSVETGDTISLVTLVGYMIERRLIDNLFSLVLNSGIEGKRWQQQQLPLSAGEHSLRIGVKPDDAKAIFDRVHRIFLEDRIST